MMTPLAIEPDFHAFPEMNRLLREQLVGRTVVDLMMERDNTIIALDNGAVLELPRFSFAFIAR